jgi:hypothetical protein
MCYSLLFPFALFNTQQAVPTCGDIDIGRRGAQPWYCDPAKGLAQNPNAAMFPNPSDAVSTEPICLKFQVQH